MILLGSVYHMLQYLGHLLGFCGHVVCDSVSTENLIIHNIKEKCQGMTKWFLPTGDSGITENC